MKKYIFPILIMIITLAVFFHYIPLERIPEIPKQIHVRGIGLGFLFYLLSYIFVAMRWRLLFVEGLGHKFKCPLPLLTVITSAHQFYANILPVRTGDLTIVYLARRHLGIEGSKGMTSLIIARAMDVIMLGFLALFFIVWQRHNTKLMHPGALSCAVLFISIPILGVVSAILWGKRIAGWIDDHVTRFLARRGSHLLLRIAGFLSRTARLLSERKSLAFYSKCAVFSLAIMVLRISYLTAFATHAATPVEPLSAPLVGLSTLIVSTTPLQGFMGMGAFEGGWVLGYALVGLSTTEGLMTAVNAHLLVIFFLLLLGSLSNLILFNRKPVKFVGDESKKTPF